MAENYQLSYTAEEIDNKLGQIDNSSKLSEIYNKTEINSLLQNNIKMWQPNTEYKVGDYVLALIFTEIETGDNEFTNYKTLVGMYCTTDKHTSSSTIEDDLKTGNWTWLDIDSKKSISAINDGLDRTIHETYATKEEVDNYLGSLSGGIVRIIVDTLPTEPSEINENAIYMIPSQKGAENNIYDEYMFFEDNGVLKPEIIGSTAIDLSNYYTKAEIDEVAQALVTRDEVESDYYNAITVDEMVRNNIKLWQSGTEYNVGDCCIMDTMGYMGAPESVVATCLVKHAAYLPVADISDGKWQINMRIYADASIYDSVGNIIHETYATKDELGNIETALDELHNYAQALINEGVE